MTPIVVITTMAMIIIMLIMMSSKVFKTIMRIMRTLYGHTGISRTQKC